MIKLVKGKVEGETKAQNTFSRPQKGQKAYFNVHIKMKGENKLIKLKPYKRNIYSQAQSPT